MNAYEPLSIVRQEVPTACTSCHKKDFKVIDINFEDEDLSIFAECKNCGNGHFFIYGKKRYEKEEIVEKVSAIKRKVSITIENDEIGDDLWNPLIVETLRELADHTERTQGSGTYPMRYRSANGNKIIEFAGTCIDEIPLLDNESFKRREILSRKFKI